MKIAKIKEKSRVLEGLVATIMQCLLFKVITFMERAAINSHLNISHYSQAKSKLPKELVAFPIPIFGSEGNFKLLNTFNIPSYQIHNNNISFGAHISLSTISSKASLERIVKD